MQPQIPLTRDLVLIGGGHAHALALRMWGMNPLPGARLTLINPGPTAPYSGMLPGHIAGHYRRDELDIDLVKLARFAGARLINGAATAIDPKLKRIDVAGHAAIQYDVASIDVGIHAEMPEIDGFSEYGVGAKPLDRYAESWRDFVQRVERGEAKPQVAVVGGGVAGTELALAMARKLRTIGATPEITLIEMARELTGFAPSALSRATKALDRFGVRVLTGTQVAKISADSVTTSLGEEIASAFTVGAAGAFAHGWLADSGLPLTEDGFIEVDETLRVSGVSDLFAVGDCAHLMATPRPKAGVFAVRAAPVLAHNLRACLSDGRLKPFRPQKDFLKLVSLGEKNALAEKWGRSFAGPALWGWKNRIDQRFMDRFRNLPEMAQDRLPRELAAGVREELGAKAQMLCTGCGSKVAAGVLSETLAELPRIGRQDVLIGPGDDAALLAMGDIRQVVTTDHLRAFTEDPQRFARIAALHALGDIWAMGAEPQAVLIQITVPRQSEALQARVLEEMMVAANDVISNAGAEIVGGHTTMGAETILGFTVTGLLDGPAVTLAGARAGDVIVLTRPIGSGTLLAGEMQGRANGRHIEAMFAEMERPQASIAKAMRAAHAMTDVTGFGLAGHLLAMARASGLRAALSVDAIPTYDGALDLSAAGVHSTIYKANAEAAPVDGMGNPAHVALLHDPQTAGGFVAAVSREDLAALHDAVKNAGGHLYEFGSFDKGPVGIDIV